MTKGQGRRARARPHWIFYPALALSAAAVILGLDSVPLTRWAARDGAVAYPTPDAGGLLSAPVVGLVAFVALGVLLIARWERGREPRHDPLSLVALGLLAVGQLLIAQAARAGAEAGAPIPGLAALQQAGPVLLLAMLAGAVSLVRIERARPRRRGLVFALAGLVGAPCTLPPMLLLQVERAEARVDEELELARSDRAFIEAPDRTEAPSPVMDVLAGGELRVAAALDSTPTSFGLVETGWQRERLLGALQLLAGALPLHDGRTDTALLLRIDRAAEFRFVREALRAAGDAGLWKVRLALVRSGHGVHGFFFLLLDAGEDAPAARELDSTRLVRLAWQDGAPLLELGGDAMSRAALAGLAAERAWDPGAPQLVLVPDDGVPWEAVVGVLEELASSPLLHGWPGGFLLGDPP